MMNAFIDDDWDAPSSHKKNRLDDDLYDFDDHNDLNYQDVSQPPSDIETEEEDDFGLVETESSQVIPSMFSSKFAAREQLPMDKDPEYIDSDDELELTIPSIGINSPRLNQSVILNESDSDASEIYEMDSVTQMNRLRISMKKSRDDKKKKTKEKKGSRKKRSKNKIHKSTESSIEDNKVSKNKLNRGIEFSLEANKVSIRPAPLWRPPPPETEFSPRLSDTFRKGLYEERKKQELESKFESSESSAFEPMPGEIIVSDTQNKERKVKNDHFVIDGGLQDIKDIESGQNIPEIIPSPKAPHGELEEENSEIYDFEYDEDQAIEESKVVDRLPSARTKSMTPRYPTPRDEVEESEVVDRLPSTRSQSMTPRYPTPRDGVESKSRCEDVSDSKFHEESIESNSKVFEGEEAGVRLAPSFKLSTPRFENETVYLNDKERERDHFPCEASYEWQVTDENLDISPTLQHDEIHCTSRIEWPHQMDLNTGDCEFQYQNNQQSSGESQQWTVCYTNEGHRYFYEQITGVSQWEDPRGGSCVELQDNEDWLTQWQRRVNQDVQEIENQDTQVVENTLYYETPYTSREESREHASEYLPSGAWSHRDVEVRERQGFLSSAEYAVPNLRFTSRQQSYNSQGKTPREIQLEQELVYMKQRADMLQEEARYSMSARLAAESRAMYTAKSQAEVVQRVKMETQRKIIHEMNSVVLNGPSIHDNSIYSSHGHSEYWG